jgi:hypothetical protein
VIVGHLAVSALEYRYARVDLVPVMAAAVVPDLVDKIAHYVVGSTEFGRLWGHTLLAALVSTVFVALLFGKRSATCWALGYVSHLVCDIGGVVPWLYPLVSYEFPPAETFEATLWMGLTRPRMLLELALLVWAYLSLKPQLRDAAKRLRDQLLTKWHDRQRRPLNP